MFSHINKVLTCVFEFNFILLLYLFVFLLTNSSLNANLHVLFVVKTTNSIECYSNYLIKGENVDKDFENKYHNLLCRLRNTLALLEILVVAIEQNEYENKLYLTYFAKMIVNQFRRIHVRMDKLFLKM